MDHVVRPTLAGSPLQRIDHPLGPQGVRHGPTDNPRLTLHVWLAAPRIEHDGPVEQPCRCRDERRIGPPRLVRRGRGELAVHQVRRGAGFLVAPRGRDRNPAACSATIRMNVRDNLGEC